MLLPLTTTNTLHWKYNELRMCCIHCETNCSVVFSTSRVRTVQCGEYQGLIFWGGGDQLLSFLDFAPSTAFVFPSLHSAYSAPVGARLKGGGTFLAAPKCFLAALKWKRFQALLASVPSLDLSSADTLIRALTITHALCICYTRTLYCKCKYILRAILFWNETAGKNNSPTIERWCTVIKKCLLSCQIGRGCVWNVFEVHLYCICICIFLYFLYAH